MQFITLKNKYAEEMWAAPQRHCQQPVMHVYSSARVNLVLCTFLSFAFLKFFVLFEKYERRTQEVWVETGREEVEEKM